MLDFKRRLERIIDDIRLASRRLSHPLVYDSSIKIEMERTARYFINSEGSVIKTGFLRYIIHISGESIAEDGMPLSNYRRFTGVGLSRFASRRRIFTKQCNRITPRTQRYRRIIKSTTR